MWKIPKSMVSLKHEHLWNLGRTKSFSGWTHCMQFLWFRKSSASVHYSWGQPHRVPWQFWDNSLFTFEKSSIFRGRLQKASITPIICYKNINNPFTSLFINPSYTHHLISTPFNPSMHTGKVAVRLMQPSDLVFDLSPWQLSHSELHQHVKQRPEVVMATHFLQGHK